VMNGGGQGIYHHDGIQTSPVSAGGAQWDSQAPQQQSAVHGGSGSHSRQQSGMIVNGVPPGTSPQQQHAHAQHSQDAFIPHGNGMILQHDSGISSTSQQHLAPGQMNQSPPSDGTTPPSFPFNESDKHSLETLLYPPPLNTEQGISSSMEQVPTNMSMSGHHNGIQGYEIHSAPHQPMQLPHQQHQHSQSLPPQQHLGPHQQQGQMHVVHQQYQGVHGGMYPPPSMPTHQPAVIEYEQSGSYYLQEEYDNPMPMDGLPTIPAQNGMWTS